jgi:hypothetical protein
VKLEIKVEGGDAVIASIAEKYPKMIAAEATRVTKAQRSKVRKEIIAETRKTRFFNARFFSGPVGERPVDKFMHRNPESDRVTVADVVSGFSKTIEASNARPNLWVMQKTSSAQVQTSRGKRWMITTNHGGKTSQQRGAFWITWATGKPRWTSSLQTGQRGVALARRGAYPYVIGKSGNLGLMKAPSVAAAIRKSGKENSLQEKAQTRYTFELNRRLTAIHRRLSK